jgi:hypothetical protein
MNGMRARLSGVAADVRGNHDLDDANRINGYVRNAFYLVVLTTALVGQVTGLQERYPDLDAWVALPPLAALELGGVVFMSNADIRRQMGESAIPSRIISAVFALGATAFNATAHHDPLRAAFFAGMSLAGYAVYLINAGNKRRDRLRKMGQLEATTPAYGLWHWLRHPGLTRRARALAQANAAARLAEGEHPTMPVLGRAASLASAREQVRKERRESALGRSVSRLIAAGAGKEMAAIAVDTYDMSEIAHRLADRADYDGLTTLLASRLTAEKLTGAPAQKAAHGDDLEALMTAVAPTQPTRVEAVVSRPRRQVQAELDGVWVDLVSRHPAVYGATQVRQIQPAQRDRRESTGEPRQARTVAAQGRPTSRRRKRLTVQVDPHARMAQEFAALSESLGRKPSGAELAKAAQVSKAAANRWKSQQG